MVAAVVWWHGLVFFIGLVAAFASGGLVQYLLIVWLLPDAQALPARKERRRIYLGVADWLAGRARFVSLLILVVELCVFALFEWLFDLITRAVPAIVALSLALLVWLIVKFLDTRPSRADVVTGGRRLLVESGVPMCVYCGYSLQGAPGPTCPECGRGPYPGILRPRNAQ